MSFPNFPGVPPLLNPGPVGLTTLAAPLISKLLDSFAPKWGIYNMPKTSSIEAAEVKPVIVPDNVISVDYVNVSNILNYPVEEGSFASYNKIKTPRSHTVIMSKGGSTSVRTAFIQKLEELQESLDLFAIVTPEKNYINVNIDRVEFRRTATNGAGMIMASIHFVEIRQAEIAFSGQASPTATKPQAQANINNGQTQAGSVPSNTSPVAQ